MIEIDGRLDDEIAFAKGFMAELENPRFMSDEEYDSRPVAALWSGAGQWCSCNSVNDNLFCLIARVN